MSDNIFQQGLQALRGLLDFDADPGYIRDSVIQGLGITPDEKERAEVRRQVEELMERKRLQQPKPIISEVPEYEPADPYDIPEFDGATEGAFDLGTPEDFDLRTPEEEADDNMWTDQMTQEAVQGINEETIGVTMTEQEARNTYLQDIKRMENANEEGLTYDGAQEVFKPIKSLEGRGPDKTMSKFEIGYGVKIPESWLSDNKDEWPVLEGVKLNVKKGITKDQAEALTKNLMNKAYDTASTKVTNWGEMTEREKTYWADLIYNGGHEAINKNPNALKAEEKGLTVEAMVRTLDFIKSGGKRNRGLLNRRITMYNQAALEITGAPIIESYQFGKEIKVKFASRFMTKKMGKKLSKQINDNDGWFHIATEPSQEKVVSRKADDDYKFIS